ncbi:est [Symbiodinium natans]|uniref:Est protein n=1 Tax=Symbiodinium natans TaxID=878477 RepID=A0A812QBT7_9DINO|nr:est [Symbiodinium natans]
MPMPILPPDLMVRDVCEGNVKALGGCRCFSVDYPKPPQAPYPAALENALEVWQWLRDQGLKAKDVVVSGDSAGGNLALALLLKLQAIGAEMPAGAVLLSPWVEMLPFNSKSWTHNAAYDYIGTSIRLGFRV